MKLPAELPAAAVIPAVDSREQQRLILPALGEPKIVTLTTGDYSIFGAEPNVVAIERKSLPDLLACCGRERPRFDREVERLLGFQTRALVVESDWPEIERGEWRSELRPNHVIGALLGWQAMGLPVLLVGNHERAGQYVARLLYTVARRRWHEARSLVAGVQSLGSDLGTVVPAEVPAI